MHRAFGLSSEVTNQTARKPLDPAFAADQSTIVSPEVCHKKYALSPSEGDSVKVFALIHLSFS